MSYMPSELQSQWSLKEDGKTILKDMYIYRTVENCKFKVVYIVSNLTWVSVIKVSP